MTSVTKVGEPGAHADIDATRRSLGHVPGLDGLRGAAVVAVVAYHLRLVHGGFLGVDVFFVLSGFLITSLLLAETSDTGSVHLRGFWGRRFRRLVPAVLVMVAVALVAAIAIAHWPRTRIGATTLDGLSTLTWWANWRQAAGTSYWAAGSPNLFRHAWSLSIEEQFYLVWPVVVLVAVAWCRRRGRRPARVVGAIAVAGFAASATWLIVLAHRLADEDLSRAYVGTDTRVLAPLAGCALAAWWADRRDRAHRQGEPVAPVASRQALAGVGAVATTVLLALVATADVASPTLYRRGGFIVVALAAVALILAVVAAGPDQPVGTTRWASGRTIRYLGLRSYGIYLWSWPTQVIIERRFPDAPRGAVVLSVVVISVELAEISYQAIEQPLRRHLGWAARPQLRRPAWGLILVLPVVTLLAFSSLAVAPPAHERIDTAQSVTDAIDHAPPTTTSTVAAEVAPDAGTGGVTASLPPSKVSVMLIGDSVAWTAGYRAPFAALPTQIASIDSRAVIGCGLLAASGWEYPQADEGEGSYFSPGKGACRKQLLAEQVGLSGRPDVVIAMPGAWEHSSARAPDGHVVAARSREMRRVLIDNLLSRALQAKAAGAGFAMVEWSCPGVEAGGARRDPGYIRWINQVMHDVARTAEHDHGVDAWVIAPDATVCTGGDPTGDPTAAKASATANEVHYVDAAGGAWFWDDWMQPALARHFG